LILLVIRDNLETYYLLIPHKEVLNIYNNHNDTLFVGIDVSKKTLTSRILNGNGDSLLKNYEVVNNRNGCKNLIQQILNKATNHQVQEVQIGMEATNVFWVHAYRLIANYKPLNKHFNLPMYRLNPKLVNHFKKAYNDLPKTDDIDAWIIADRLRFGRVDPSNVLQKTYEPLRQSTRFRFKTGESIRTEKNRALNLIFLKFSNYKDEAPFSAFSNASIALLKKFSPDEIATTDIQQLANFLLENSNHRLGGDTPVDKLAKIIKKAARNAYRLTPEMNDAVSRTLSMTFENIKFMQSQLNKIDKAIKRQFKAIPQTLTTVPGIGDVFAAGIVSEIEDINYIDGQAALASMAGLTWSKYQSGAYQAEDTHLRKTGNKYLRYYLVEAANSLRVRNDKYRRYYYKKYRESSTHKHKRALVLTARKLVHLVYALLSKGEIYQPRR
jgi:transposase